MDHAKVGIRERRNLREEGLGSSDLGENAVRGLLEKTNTSPEDIDLLICATVTPDMAFPATANIISDKVGIINAFSFDLNAACSGFLFALQTGAAYIESGKYKKVVIVGADKMSSIRLYRQDKLSPSAMLQAVCLSKQRGLWYYGLYFHTDGSGQISI
jgi:3-oxoacyl-[acyl-carrier-protein] synthase-3